MKPFPDGTAHAYFCAKCQSTRTDPSAAIRFAKQLNLELWVPADRVTNCRYPEGALECKEAIAGCRLVIVQPPIGTDCAWEMGYAVGSLKPIYVIGDLPTDEWMTRISANHVAEIDGRWWIMNR